MIYKLRHTICGELREMTLPKILEEINADRSEGWENYDETDWREGLEEFTDLEVIEEVAA